MTFVAFPIFTPSTTMPGTNTPIPHHHNSQLRFFVEPHLREALGTVPTHLVGEGVECMVAWNRGLVQPSLVRLPVGGQVYEVDPDTFEPIIRSIEWQAQHLRSLYAAYGVKPEDRAAPLQHEVERDLRIEERAAAAAVKR